MSAGQTILREWLGGCESIDLSTQAGRDYFADEVVQDREVAADLMDRLLHGEDEIVVNGNEAEFIERYTREANS